MIGGSLAAYAFPVVQKGRVDAVVMWFDLQLDEETSISTSPHQSSCWEQAVHPTLHQHVTQQGGLARSLLLIFFAISGYATRKENTARFSGRLSDLFA